MDYIRNRQYPMSDILAIDWIKALWADARAETDPARKAQLERDAAIMEDAWNRSKYSLAATKDQITAALGNASLNLAERLDDVVSGYRTLDNRVGEIHQHVQEGHTLISVFVESFPTQFAVFQTEMRDAAEENRTRLGKLEQGQVEYNARLDDVDTRHTEQWQLVIERLDNSDERLDRKREMLRDHAERIVALEQSNARLAVQDARIQALEDENTRLAAVEAALIALAARIEVALPTEDDQDLSAQLRVDAAERSSGGS
jgi:DNA repair exonuclease SbcCD ATPase subunit